ncbi:MAG: 30S ribosomal protein S11 [Candidatus Pacebacteria bacterium]|nr:30S ribosomal protein S11 [Candidatus Paceibacterota bacterium]MDD5721696.1 30S ribosomal protein S11 [Candidatus Paceibacterota bacterium]
MGKKRVITKAGAESGKIAEKVAAAKSKTSIKKIVEKGRVYILASYNNTSILITDLKGNALAWSSAGSLGFRGPKKATPYAASRVVGVLMEKIKKMGMKTAEIYLKGIGGGRDMAVRSFANQGLDITMIKDVTPVPHNGPRPRKARRV